MNIIKRRASAFTLAEMMVVLLVLSLITAAFLPVITTKSRSVGNNSPWTWSNSGSNAIFDAGNVTGAVIGVSNFAADDPTSKLMINTATLGPNHILFKENGVRTGRLVVDGRNNVGLGNIAFDTVPPAAPTKSFITAMGNAVTASGQSSSAFGYGAQALDTRATSVGSLANATGSYSVAVGSGLTNPSRAIGHYSVAIGSDSSTFSNNSVAVGLYAAAGTSGNQFGTTSATAVGNLAIASLDNSAAFGVSANATASGALALGSSAVASGSYSAALTPSSNASGSKAVSAGFNSTAAGNFATALGYMSKAANPSSVAIGDDAEATADQAVAIGFMSRANVANQIVLGGPGSNTKVTGSLLVGNFVSGGTALYQNMGMLSTSDRRLKNVGGEFTDGLDKIRELKSYNYTFKQDKEKTPRVGIMAQDLQKVFPKAIFKLDKEGHLGIRQEDMFYAMINSIKQLDKMVQELVARVGVIDEKITMLINANKTNSQKIDKLAKELNEVKAQNKQLKSQVLALKAKVK